ncbi:hypothetical protein RUESEDTHA_03903 [Ruegeria sp. THAF57]|uniref:Crp/Fnr family transcriptional regulator n=1 Tax=Ruegeria sp. THAF57 TaxID=2744555 RepID=UPI0015DFAA8B|nr:helix-turn-helix domain-containing protein [Ruegeria sp. THAF57]CAD0186992.1 hypothetical protein RUESEDTHA_03903 [Ruegeria sp. THAF57]
MPRPFRWHSSDPGRYRLELFSSRVTSAATTSKIGAASAAVRPSSRRLAFAPIAVTCERADVAAATGIQTQAAEAVSTCEVKQIPSPVLIFMMKEDPEIGVFILASTFTHLHSLMSQLEQLKVQTGAQRVAEFVARLCDSEDGPCEVELPYDQILIVGRLGMKPESLSRVFSRLNQRVCGSTESSDIQHLRDYTESDPSER